MTLQHDVGFGNIEKHSKYCWLFLLWLVVTLYQVPYLRRRSAYAAGQHALVLRRNSAHIKERQLVGERLPWVDFLASMRSTACTVGLCTTLTLYPRRRTLNRQ